MATHVLKDVAPSGRYSATRRLRCHLWEERTRGWIVVLSGLETATFPGLRSGVICLVYICVRVWMFFFSGVDFFCT
jgi:hypothetical protein